ncbi:hypothetical protein [Anaerotruncus massiliensis (ex Togo et al. 2019)]|nr:hypothetical protein [Anaerotruncus massiliensis (ex Togo et al. 2019)]
MDAFTPETIWNEYEELLEMTRRHSFSSRIRKYRDLSILRLLGEVSLVVACDSNASNGEKPNDTHRNTYDETAVSALKVPTMEVLATGATPIVIADNLCVEMEPSGRKIISAMQEELDRCGLLDSIQFTGSTEDNMRTLQTGIGVTVVGLVSDAALRLGRTRSGDAVYCAGVPQSGIIEHYSERDGTVAKISTVAKLRELDFVHEILPVGSKGVLYEAGQLAECVGRRFLPVEQPPVDLKTSAGSCTAVLVSLPEESGAALAAELDIPCFFIGRIQ